MTPAEHGALVFEVATSTDKHFADPEQSPSDAWLAAFASIYRAALIEKMEPVGYLTKSGSFFFSNWWRNHSNAKPLYSLEDWK